MAYYSSVWFWLIIIGVILLIAGLIWYFAAGTNATSTTKTFIYALIAFGALLLLIGILFAIFDSGEPAVVAAPVAPAVVVAPATQPAATVTETVKTTTTPVAPAPIPVEQRTVTTVTTPVTPTVPVIQPQAMLPAQQTVPILPQQTVLPAQIPATQPFVYSTPQYYPQQVPLTAYSQPQVMVVPQTLSGASTPVMYYQVPPGQIPVRSVV